MGRVDDFTRSRKRRSVCPGSGVPNLTPIEFHCPVGRGNGDRWLRGMPLVPGFYALQPFVHSIAAVARYVLRCRTNGLGQRNSRTHGTCLIRARAPNGLDGHVVADLIQQAQDSRALIVVEPALKDRAWSDFPQALRVPVSKGSVARKFGTGAVVDAKPNWLLALEAFHSLVVRRASAVLGRCGKSFSDQKYQHKSRCSADPKSQARETCPLNRSIYHFCLAVLSASPDVLGFGIYIVAALTPEQGSSVLAM